VPSNLALLPRRDQDYLLSKGVDFAIAQAPDGVHLTIAHFVFPAAYKPIVAALRIVLPPGYDNANPDMFWTQPNVMLRNGQFPLTADYIQPFADGLWQRWSRHFATGWRPGIDGIRTYLASIRRELARGL
jgi:hypothetical protein